MVAIWNAFAADHDLSQSRPLNPDRRRKALCRLEECDGIEGWRAAVASIADSPWLLGENDGKWKASMSFMLQRESFTKVLEGNYIRRTEPRSML